MSKDQPAPVSLRLRPDLRDQVDAAVAEYNHTAHGTPNGETGPLRRNGWIVLAIEEKLARNAAGLSANDPAGVMPTGPMPDPYGEAARARAIAGPPTAADFDDPPPGDRPKADPPPAARKETAEYRFQTRPVGSVHQWRQDGATTAKTASTLTAVRDAARAAIKAAGETRPFTIKLIAWKD